MLRRDRRKAVNGSVIKYAYIPYNPPSLSNLNFFTNKLQLIFLDK